VNPAEPVRGGGIERIAVAPAHHIGGENQHDGQPMEGLGAGAVARGSAAQTDYLTPILSPPQRLRRTVAARRRRFERLVSWPVSPGPQLYLMTNPFPKGPQSVSERPALFSCFLANAPQSPRPRR